MTAEQRDRQERLREEEYDFEWCGQPREVTCAYCRSTFEPEEPDL